MAARYWVSGTGNWDASDTTHWAASSGGTGGETVPGSSDQVTFDGSSGGGTVTVTATVTVESITAGDFTGTLDTNGQTITTSNNFSISGTATRTVTFGGSTINVAGFWTATTTTNLTFNANTSTININGTSNQQFGGLTYNNVVLTGATLTMLGANTFANLTRTGTTVKTGTFVISANQVITGTLTITGNSLTNRILVQSNTLGTARTLTAAVVSLSNCDFQDITAAGAASPFTGTSIGNSLGNTNITPTATATRYWVANGGTWSDTAHWSTSTGGSAGASVPLCHDTAVFDVNSITSASQTITADMPRMGTITFAGDGSGAMINTPTLSFGSTATSIFGSLTLTSLMTITGAQRTTLSGRSSLTLTSAGQTFTQVFTMAMFGGTLTLQDSFSSSAANDFLLDNGTINANNFNVTLFGISSSNANIRGITMGSGTWTITGTSPAWNLATTTNLTFSADTSTIKYTNVSATTKNFFSTSGLTYHNFWFAPGTGTGSLTIFGSNTFNQFKDDGSAAHSILFTAGTTTTIADWQVSGNSGSLISINSTTTGTHALVKTGSDKVSADFLNIQHSVATPSNIWYAGLNSTNNQADVTAGSGWLFRGVPITSPFPTHFNG